MYNTEPLMHERMSAKKLIEESCRDLIDIVKAYNNEKGKEYVFSGLDDLYFKKGTLNIICASGFPRYLAGMMLEHIALEDKRPASYITTCQEETTEFGVWLVASKVGDPFHYVRGVTMKDLEKFQKSAEELYDSPLSFGDEPNGTFEDLSYSIRHLAEFEKTEIVFINSFDCLFEMAHMPEDANPVETTRELLVNYRELAQELNVAIVMLMNCPELKYKKEIFLSDFNDNAIIPHMADQLLTFAREGPESTTTWNLKRLKCTYSHCNEWEFKYDLEEKRFVLQ